MKLDTALNDYVDLERKYKDLHRKYTELDRDIKNKEKEIIAYKERGKELDDKINDLNKTIEQVKIDFAVERKSREDFKNQLQLCQQECIDNVRKEAEAKSKVSNRDSDH